MDREERKEYKEEILDMVMYLANSTYSGYPISQCILEDICKEILFDENI